MSEQQATPGDMYMYMCMYMCMYMYMCICISMHMPMPMRMWMRMRIGETGGPCLARVRCAHAARVAVADIRAAGRLPCVCVLAHGRMLINTVWVAQARLRERAC
jgi:hypothetical protein